MFSNKDENIEITSTTISDMSCDEIQLAEFKQEYIEVIKTTAYLRNTITKLLEVHYQSVNNARSDDKSIDEFQTQLTFLTNA